MDLWPSGAADVMRKEETWQKQKKEDVAQKQKKEKAVKILQAAHQNSVLLTRKNST
jgi:hypothetical protein